MLHVVVSDVEVDGEYEFTRRVFGSQPEALRSLATWLVDQDAEEVVMESTAQYWRPVWETLERYWKQDWKNRQGAHSTSGTLHLAQAQSNRGRRGPKKDFRDAERLVKRLVANELVLSFVPDAEQRLWRTVMHTKYQARRNRVQLQNRLEALLEEAHIKISSLVSDLLLKTHDGRGTRTVQVPRLLSLPVASLQGIALRPLPCNYKVLGLVCALSRRKRGFESRRGRHAFSNLHAKALG
jgi:Transposase